MAENNNSYVKAPQASQGFNYAEAKPVAQQAQAPEAPVAQQSQAPEAPVAQQAKAPFASAKMLSIEELKDMRYIGKAMTVEQDEALNKHIEDENKNTATLDRKKAPKDIKAPKHKPIFEERDIIDYMFKEWFLKSADWVGNACIVCPIECMMMAASEGVSDARAEKAAIKNDETYKFKTGVVATSDREMKKLRDDKIKYTAADFEQIVEKANAGKWDEINPKEIPEGMKEMMAKTGKKVTAQEFANMRNNAKELQKSKEVFAINYATAKMLSNKAKDQKSYLGKDIDASFVSLKEGAEVEFMNLYVNRDQSKDPSGKEMVASLCKDSAEAAKCEVKGIDRGQYDERRTSPRSNPYLQNIEDKIKEQGRPASEKPVRQGLQEAAQEVNQPIPMANENTAGQDFDLADRMRANNERRARIASFQNKNPNVAAQNNQKVDYASLRYAGR